MKGKSIQVVEAADDSGQHVYSWKKQRWWLTGRGSPWLSTVCLLTRYGSVDEATEPFRGSLGLL